MNCLNECFNAGYIESYILFVGRVTMKHIPSRESHFSQELEIHICPYNKCKKKKE